MLKSLLKIRKTLAILTAGKPLFLEEELRTNE